MSSTYDKQTYSPVQTRRTRATNDDGQSNRRSFSNTIRNLFRKSSSSPTRTNNNSAHTSPVVSRQRSQSPGVIRASNEAPHLQAPTVRWPFGKRKTKKRSVPPSNISRPIYEEDHQTSIRGQNFIPRTPDLAHGGTVRSQSSASYDAATKGFRDYTIIDQSQQVVVPDADIITPPPYISDHSRSPSLNRHRLPDTNFRYSYRQDISPNGVIPTPQQQRKLIDNPSLTTTQILAQKSPLIPSRVSSNQWMGTSTSSLNNTDLRPTLSASTDTDVPKLNAPLIPFGSTSSRKNTNRPDFQSNINEKYNSSSNVHGSIQPDQSYRFTYGSLPDAEILHNDNFNPLKPIRSNANGYPGLSAIIQHHVHPETTYYNEHSPLNPHRPVRFDTSTTTNDFQWSNGAAPSPPAIHHHDGYIRPLTPQKSIQPDIIHDDSHSRLPLNYHTSEPPVVYRSSTTIYTKDKRNYGDNGRIQTWSAQENDTKPSISYPTSPPKVYVPQQEEEKYHVTFEHEPQYFENPHSNTNSSFTRRSIEREKIYDQPTRSYKETERTQEPFYTTAPVQNYEGGLRHIILKRTDSYDGLGILLTADAVTRLNHRIHDIEASSPAYRAGLRKNDRIISVNGINVENVEFSDVLVIIKDGLKNNNLQLSVLNESTFI